MATSEGWWSDTMGLAGATGPAARGIGPPICVSVCITPSWLAVLKRRAQHLNSRQFLQDGEGRTCCMMAPLLQKALINKD